VAVKVLVFAGSLRQASLNKKLARLAAGALERAGSEVDLADFREFEVPLYDGDLEAASGVPAGALKLKDRLHAAGSLCLVTPEYNHSIPGTVKNAIDWLSRIRPNALANVPALLMSASPGLAGGSRAAWAVRVPLELLGTLVYPGMFTLAQANQRFGPDGGLKDDDLAERLEKLCGDFVAYARALEPFAGARRSA
jgi:NAD(P)H-dependent FMN reductase